MSQTKSYLLWLYATRVSAEDEATAPVRYHQCPCAPAYLFAELRAKHEC
jgi:hypothetical protein